MEDSFFSIDEFGFSIVADFGVFLSPIIHKPCSRLHQLLPMLMPVS